jgi:hypothetical protein
MNAVIASELVVRIRSRVTSHMRSILLMVLLGLAVAGCGIQDKEIKPPNHVLDPRGN